MYSPLCRTSKDAGKFPVAEFGVIEVRPIWEG